MGLDDDSDIELYKLLNQDQLDQITLHGGQQSYDGVISEQAVQSKVNLVNNIRDGQEQNLTVNNNNLTNTMTTMPLEMRDTADSGLSNNLEAHRSYSQKYNEKWEYNFQIALGPANPAFIEATLSEQDIADDYILEYNPNGILWRVNAAGIPHPDDLENYFEQNRTMEEATNQTVAELKSLPEILNISSAFPTGNKPVLQKNISANQPENAFNKLAKPSAVSLSTFSNIKLEATSAFVQFDRKKAVEYALKYADSSNPEYPNFGDNDCTNFVSQCWQYAGVPISLDWFCTNVKQFHSKSWTDVEEFANYMVQAGYCYISYSSNNARVGDVIQFYNEKDGWHHSAIITEIDDEGNIKYSGHSNARTNERLSGVYPQNGEQIRILCIYQRLCEYDPSIPTA